MNPTIIVAIIGGIAIILSAYISGKWTKKTTENKFLVIVQTTYTKLITDLELTNTRLREQRDKDEAKIASDKLIIDKHISQFDELKKEMGSIKIELENIKPKICLFPNCTKRVMP